MKVNFSQAIKDFEGETVKDEMGKELSLSEICVKAILALFKSEENISGEEKYKRYKLSDKIYNKSEVELSAEEVAEVKKLVGKMYSPLVVGLVYDILEGR